MQPAGGGGEEDEVSQLKDSVATVRSLRLMQRNSGSHRIGTFVAFEAY